MEGRPGRPQFLAADAVKQNSTAEHQSNEQAGYNAGNKQFADRLFGKYCIDNEYDAGRNEHAQAASGSHCTAAQLH
jgi:hypothetical protein